MNSVATAGRVNARRSASTNQVLALASVGTFMTVLDLFIVNVAFPDIQRDFAGSSLSSLSWVLNGYAIIYAALLVAAGRIADRSGQKRGFLTGVGTLHAIVAYLRGRVRAGRLDRGRVLQAAGAAAVLPTSLALILNAGGARDAGPGRSAFGARSSGLRPRRARPSAVCWSASAGVGSFS